MKLENLMVVSWQNLMRNKRRVFFSSLGVVVGIATLIFFFALTNGARNLIFNHFLNQLPSNQMRINPKYKTDLTGYLVGGLLGGDSREGMTQDKDWISQKKVEEIRALPGVKAVHGMLQIIPKCYLHPFEADYPLHTQTGISSYHSEFLKDDIPEGKEWKWEPDQNVVPAIINPQLLIAWNETFAGKYNYPKLDAKTIMNFPIFLKVRNPVTYEDYQFKFQVIGLSTKASFFAPLVPEEFVTEMNLRAFGEDYREAYTSLIVTARDSTEVGPLMAKFEEMGLEAGGEQKVAEMISMGINVITLFLTSISLIIVFISLVNVFNIFLINVMERKFEIGVMRAVGAGRGEIRAIILSESAFIGFVSGLLGALIGVAAVLLMDPLFQPLLEKLVVDNANFFVINPELILAVILLTPIVNIIAVFHPANTAAGLDPVEALRR